MRKSGFLVALLATVLLIAGLLLASCGGAAPAPAPKPTPAPAPAPAPTPAPTPAPAAAPTVKITTPAAGATVSAGNVQVSVQVSNFELVPPGANAAGKGHLHYYLDVEIPTTPGKGAVSAPGTYKATPGTTATWDNVTAGSHTFGVQLVNGDHTPLSPPVTAKVTVTVGAAAPSGGGAIDASKLYASNCAACHGANRQGIPGTFPALTATSLTGKSDADLTTTITKGKTGTAMTAFEGKLSAAEIDALVKFIKQ